MGASTRSGRAALRCRLVTPESSRRRKSISPLKRVSKKKKKRHCRRIFFFFAHDLITFFFSNFWGWRPRTRAFLNLGAHLLYVRRCAALGYTESSLGSATSRKCSLRRSFRHWPVCPIYSPSQEKGINRFPPSGRERSHFYVSCGSGLAEEY